MLIWRECPSIYVDIRVNLDTGNSDTMCLEYGTNTAGNNTLTNTTDNSSSYQYILHG